LASEDDFINEIVKQLPIKAAYRDAVRPAARQTGELAEDFVKTLRLALFPLQLAAVTQDRFRRFIDAAINRVPADKRLTPPPQIVGPVLEGIRYEPENSPIEAMFSELLSSSMHSDRVKDAHPAIPLVIKQLSSDEASILRAIALSPKLFELVLRFDLRNGLAITSVERSDVPVDGLVFPQNADMYRDRLERLGLIRFDALKPMEAIYDGGQQTGGRNFLVVKLTEFGATFMRACGTPPALPV
jgi:Abortive infection alpha